MIRSRRLRYLLSNLRHSGLWHEYHDRTMQRRRRYADNLFICAETLRMPGLDRGAVIECGTWRGGMAAGMIRIGGPRDYWILDSFVGLPPAGPLDGDRAHPDSPAITHNNCAAALEDVELFLQSVVDSEQRLHILPGWFEITVPRLASQLGEGIAILRLDGDWYESTMACLTGLYDHVLPGGCIIIDDYYDWEGCTRAVHDFLSQRKSFDRIRSTPNGVAYIQKQPA
jgi:O-methyltransferase